MILYSTNVVLALFSRLISMTGHISGDNWGNGGPSGTLELPLLVRSAVFFPLACPN